MALLAFDIGGTNVRMGISTDGKTIETSTEFLTKPDDYDATLKEFAETAEKLAGDKGITGAAGGIPGPLKANNTTIGTAPNLPGWHNKPFAKDAGKLLNVPFFLENDTATIGVGEATQGAGREYEIVVYLTVSTGVGGCRVVGGEIDESARGFEPGHQIVILDEVQCACGGKGHLEGLIGGAAMEKRYGKKPADIEDPEVWDTAAFHLAIGLNNVLMLWSPHIFVLGGSMMKDISIEKTAKYLDDMVAIYDEIPPIVPAELGPRGGFLGGLAILRSHGVKV